MRYRKKEFRRRLDQMKEVNRRFMQRKRHEKPPALEELAFCQSTAIEMGNCLETLGETGAPGVRILEDYCENIYRQSLHLSDVMVCRGIGGNVKRQLEQLESMFRSDLPEGKKEAVFLPYKASMWDSLESVWMAARDDKDCEAVVVPIPYFDKNPDGSLGQMHDEKDLYPDYVPVTDWREYSIQERCPDMIYIHNPYDNANSITSVHPSYYTRELKKYTDMLVYIPYFVGINNHVEAHLCVLPGTMRADRIIVENAEIKKQYIDALRRFERENGRRGLLGDLDRKILPLGSPKMDRIRRAERGKAHIPKEWQQVLISAGMKRKKVILYNTTISSFCQYKETAINKIRHTLDIFKESHDIVLLWRPHPLLMTAARSREERLYREFCRITEEYRREGWGIYDDTADVERAIAISDAYYGDWSSVVTLYRASGKPVMIQSYDGF